MTGPKTMVFIDGENLVFRYQSMIAAGKRPSPKVAHVPDTFVWHPDITTWCFMDVIRVYYYTSVVGDERRVEETRSLIAKTVFSYEFEKGLEGAAQIVPVVFRKTAKTDKTRQVGIQIAIEMMRFAHLQSVEVLYLLSGDGDYLPLTAEIMRHGKEVYVAALSSGLAPQLKYSVDEFYNLDETFFPAEAMVEDWGMAQPIKKA